MFYLEEGVEERESYKAMLKTIGSLTRIFSESASPYLAYRAHENIFCQCFMAENLARFDCSVDAKKNKIGIGLKTWVGRDDQKVAEFGRLRYTYSELEGLALARQIAIYRNERIRITKKLYGIEEMIYHVVKRVPGFMQILESAFDEIDIENISIIKNKGNGNNTYFTDGKNEYHFSISKNTLYMIFDKNMLLDTVEVDIMDNPFEYLMNLSEQVAINAFKNGAIVNGEEKLCLRLYSYVKGGVKHVYEKSGLNQWNASGRKRNSDEIYIPYPSEDRQRALEFFPPRDEVFTLRLPDGKEIQAKVCQQNGKAIMSNPNSVLGKWLLRDVFEIKEGTLVTYAMLEKYGIDSVVFTKKESKYYTIDFSELGTYEEFYCQG